MAKVALSRKQCAVPSCNNTMANNPTVAYFSFPRNEGVGRRWLENINNPQLGSIPYSRLRWQFRVCGDHFVLSDFQTPNRQKLNRGVIPTVFAACGTQ